MSHVRQWEQEAKAVHIKGDQEPDWNASKAFLQHRPTAIISRICHLEVLPPPQIRRTSVQNMTYRRHVRSNTNPCI